MEKQIADQARIHRLAESAVLKTTADANAVKRLVEPEEVAALVGWLAGPDAAMVTEPPTPWTAGGPRSEQLLPLDRAVAVDGGLCRESGIHPARRSSPARHHRQPPHLPLLAEALPGTGC